MLFPARHCILVRGQSHFFESAADASAWIDANKKFYSPLLFARPGGRQRRRTDIAFHWSQRWDEHSESYLFFVFFQEAGSLDLRLIYSLSQRCEQCKIYNIHGFNQIELVDFVWGLPVGLLSATLCFFGLLLTNLLGSTKMLLWFQNSWFHSTPLRAHRRVMPWHLPNALCPTCCFTLRYTMLGWAGMWIIPGS